MQAGSRGVGIIVRMMLHTRLPYYRLSEEVVRPGFVSIYKTLITAHGLALEGILYDISDIVRRLEPLAVGV